MNIENEKPGDFHHIKRVVAPMVNASDAPYRILCMKYGATCAFTEMLYSHRIIHEEGYLQNMLPEQDHQFPISYITKPLIVQICGNDSNTISQAVKYLLQQRGKVIAGVDFNLGCPQERAKEEHFGSYLLDKKYWEVVFSCVRSLSIAIQEYNCDNNMQLSCSAKIRICENGGKDQYSTTLEFCKNLVISGIDIITIHGRTRGSTKFRRCGPANLLLIHKIAEYFSQNHSSVKIISNGNIVTRNDVSKMSNFVCGCMSAEGLLADPGLFSRFCHGECPDRSTLYHEYCTLSNIYYENGGWECLDKIAMLPIEESKQILIARQHLFWMLGKSGHGRTVRFQYLGSFKKHVNLLKAVKDSKTLIELQHIARDCLTGVFESDIFQEDI